MSVPVQKMKIRNDNDNGNLQYLAAEPQSINPAVIPKRVPGHRDYKVPFPLRNIRIDANTARNATSLFHYLWIKTTELRQRIKSYMTTTTHDFRKISFRISGE